MFKVSSVREPPQARITLPNLHTRQQHWVRLLVPRQLFCISKSWQRCQHLQELLLLIRGEVRSARDCSSRSYSLLENQNKSAQLKQHLLCHSLALPHTASYRGSPGGQQLLQKHQFHPLWTCKHSLRVETSTSTAAKGLSALPCTFQLPVVLHCLGTCSCVGMPKQWCKTQKQ